MLQIKNLSKSYGAKKAVSNLSFVVEDGDIMGFDYSGRSAHALKRVQRTGIAVQQSSAAVQPRPLGMG